MSLYVEIRSTLVASDSSFHYMSLHCRNNVHPLVASDVLNANTKMNPEGYVMLYPKHTRKALE